MALTRDENKEPTFDPVLQEFDVPMKDGRFDVRVLISILALKERALADAPDREFDHENDFKRYRDLIEAKARLIYENINWTPAQDGLRTIRVTNGEFSANGE